MEHTDEAEEAVQTIAAFQRSCVPIESVCCRLARSSLEQKHWHRPVVCAVVSDDAERESERDMYVPMTAVGVSPPACLVGGNMGSAARWLVRWYV